MGGAKPIIGVTLRNNISGVFTNFEFVKSVSVVGGKNLYGKVDITSEKNLKNNPVADICSFDHWTLFYLTNSKIISAVIK